MPFEPTAEQAQAILTCCRFLTSRSDRRAMILRGSAGTGKTTVAGALVRALVALHRRVVLLAPTGRAAKVFSLGSGHPAFTIHRRIYRQRAFTGVDMGRFSLNDNLHRDTLFMVDEASMVANDGFGDSPFGDGRLLDDLVRFVYQGSGCALMLIGDKAQLPPVGEEESPALTDAVMADYGLEVWSCDLNEVLRQERASGILWNATAIRQMITHDSMTQLPRIRLRGFADIAVVPGDELIEQLAGSYSEAGIDETIVVTRSNKRAGIYNQGIRARILDREEELCAGDMVMVVKNNYYWLKNDDFIDKNAPSEPHETAAMSDADDVAADVHRPMDFVANGDRCRVVRVRQFRELYGFRFADAVLQFPDYDNYELEATVLLDTLTSEAPALTATQQSKLFEGVMEDYFDITLKADKMKAVKTDRHFNALQMKYAYAVTCHKAQGGQWAHVYVDQGYMTDDMLTPDYIHWLYTAFTRATEKLFLVNWPATQLEAADRISD